MAGMESQPLLGSPLLKSFLCFSPAGQSNPGAGRLNQGPVRLMDDLNGLAFWPASRVVRGPSHGKYVCHHAHVSGFCRLAYSLAAFLLSICHLFGTDRHGLCPWSLCLVGKQTAVACGKGPTQALQAGGVEMLPPVGACFR